jgi:hypothetical protein
LEILFTIVAGGGNAAEGCANGRANRNQNANRSCFFVLNFCPSVDDDDA